MEQKINGIICSLLSICLIVSSISYADNCPVAPIKKGESAPCDGFYFNKDAEKTASQARDDASYFKALSDKQADKISLEENEAQILEKRLQLYINESNTLVKDRASSQSDEKLYLLGAFALGVIGTSLVVRNLRP